MKRHFILEILLKVFGPLRKADKAFFFRTPVIAGALTAFSILPLSMMGYFIYERYQGLQLIDNRINDLGIKVKKTKLIHTREISFIKQLKEADRAFIEESIYSLKPLQEEKKALSVLMQQQEFKESVSLIKRLEELHSNTIFLEEMDVQVKDSIQEKYYGLKKKVEVDSKDIADLLNAVESTDSGYKKPQLIFEKFIIQRKKLSKHHDVFECTFNLIERSLKDTGSS